MRVAICVDDQLGMMFHNRRQSRDQKMRENLLQLSEGPVLVNTYSAKLFSEAEQSRLIVREDFLDAAGKEDLCFVENLPLSSYQSRISMLILYRWNRNYPADTRLDLDLNEYELQEEVRFVGHSHEEIIRCTYVRKQ